MNGGIGRYENIVSTKWIRGYFVCLTHIIFVFGNEETKGGGTEINLLTPNVNYSGRTAPLTSKVAFYIFIQQI